MRFLSGLLTGVLLTILVVFVVDSLSPPAQRMVNWDRATAKVGAVQEDVREEVHEATRPDTAPPSSPDKAP